jgi:hypothetical protein
MALFSKQTSDLPVLARWTVPAPAWRDFVAAVRAFAATPGAPKCSLQHLDDPVGDGIEVRVHEDAVFVGADSLYLIYQDEVGVRMRQPEDWLEFGSDHYGWFFPVPDDARYPQSERVCDHFVALWEREAREAREARARPV